MKNYLLEFIQDNKRKPSQEEIGALMVLVAKNEPGRRKTDGYMERFNLAQRKGSLGGRQKFPINLSENALKVNDLLKKGVDPNTIAKILDLKLTSVRSITSKNSLPRPKEMILNYKVTKWGFQE